MFVLKNICDCKRRQISFMQQQFIFFVCKLFGLQVGSQQMFMQQQGGGAAGAGGGGAGSQLNARGSSAVGGFPPSQQSLQNPLAFLEKTTSNIGELHGQIRSYF